MSDNIDNTPLAVAKAEGEADAKARMNPMTKAAVEPSFLRHFARGYGKLVISNARRVGIDEHSLDEMKTRMASWVTVVEAYESDVNEVMKNKAIPMHERLKLVNEMRTTRDAMCDERFH